MHILFDIGGTNTRVALSADGQGFAEPTVFKTPESFSDGITRIISESKKLLNEKKPTSICGGIAGPLNSKKTKLVNSPHLKDWTQKPLTKELFMAFGTEKVYLENDAALAGLGEAHYGEGKKSSILAYLTISTGVGGVRIVNGKIDHSTFGFEPGHQFTEGIEKDFEQLVSGTGIKSSENKNPEDIANPAFWNNIAKKVAVGLNNVTVFWSPDTIVLGGGLIKENAINVDVVNQYFQQEASIFKIKPKLTKSSLGDTAGLFGALVYTKQREN